MRSLAQDCRLHVATEQRRRYLGLILTSHYGTMGLRVQPVGVCAGLGRRRGGNGAESWLPDAPGVSRTFGRMRHIQRKCNTSAVAAVRCVGVRARASLFMHWSKRVVAGAGVALRLFFENY